MSGQNSGAPQWAAAAAERLTGFYPTIAASDPALYATALVQLFSCYPKKLVEASLHAVDGLPGLHDHIPSIAKVKKWLDDHLEQAKAAEWKARKADEARRLRLAEPPADAAMRERVGKGLRDLSEQLKAGLGPSSIGKP